MMQHYVKSVVPSDTRCSPSMSNVIKRYICIVMLIISGWKMLRGCSTKGIVVRWLPDTTCLKKKTPFFTSVGTVAKISACGIPPVRNMAISKVQMLDQYD